MQIVKEALVKINIYRFQEISTYVFIIILYVLTINLYTDWKCLLYQKTYINKDSNTTYIRSTYWNNVYLIVYYKASVHACFAFNYLTGFQHSLTLISLVQFIFWLSLSNKLSKGKLALCSKLYNINHYAIDLDQVFWISAKLKQG